MLIKLFPAALRNPGIVRRATTALTPKSVRRPDVVRNILPDSQPEAPAFQHPSTPPFQKGRLRTTKHGKKLKLRG